MAVPQFLIPVVGESYVVGIGNGVTSAANTVYTKSFAFNVSKSFNMSADTVSDDLPDLANPSSPRQKRTVTASINNEVSGTGFVNEPTQRQLVEMFTTGKVFSLKWGTSTANGFTFTGDYTITGLSISGEDLRASTADITFSPYSAVTYSNTAINIT